MAQSPPTDEGVPAVPNTPTDTKSPHTTGRPVVDVEGLARSYHDGTTGVRDLSLTVHSGELFGLLGPNGAGKTTTMRLLTGRAVPDAGEVSVLGLDPATEPLDVRRRVGILSESARPHGYQTVREYLRFVGLVRGMADDVVDDRIHDWADRLEFGGKLDALGTDLSRGQQVKVSIAAAFLHRPDLVFVDEPVANLDPIAQSRVTDFLADYAAAGNAVFLTTHRLGVADEICTRVGILRSGELLAVGDPAADDRTLRNTFDCVVSEFDEPTQDGRRG